MRVGSEPCWAGGGVCKGEGLCGWREGEAQFTDSEDAAQAVRACGPALERVFSPVAHRKGVPLFGVGQKGE